MFREGKFSIMLIRPNTNSPSTMDEVRLVRTDSTKNVWVEFQTNDETPTNISETTLPSGEPDGELDLTVTTLGGTEIYQETYWPNTQPSARRITNPATGKYLIKYGAEGNETTQAGGVLFNWHVRENATSDDFYRTQLVEVVSPRILSILPRFRLLLDKSLKIISQVDWCTLGYSDAQLILYLQMGLSRINSAQPYPTWATLNNFPMDFHSQILLDCSLVAALESQYLFAVDTDVPSYSDQGHAFVITHSVQLKSLLDSLNARLERDIQKFKLHYINVGSVSIEMRYGLRYYANLVSSPYGVRYPGGLVPNTNTLG